MSTEERGEVTGSAAIETPSQGNQARLRKRTDDLSDLLSGVTEDNLHPEHGTGEPKGNERW